MNRRLFLGGALTTAAGLILPYEPERVYSFASRRYLRAVDTAELFLAYGFILPDNVPKQIAEAMNWNERAHDAARKIMESSSYQVNLNSLQRIGHMILTSGLTLDAPLALDAPLGIITRENGYENIDAFTMKSV